MKTPDRIQKKIVLRAPLARVWSAISDARQFGAWFGVEFEGPFVAGEPIRGVMRPTQPLRLAPRPFTRGIEALAT